MAHGLAESYRRPGVARRVLCVIGSHHGISFPDLMRQCGLPHDVTWNAANDACRAGLAYYDAAAGYKLMKRGRKIVRNESELVGA